jgi:hypothetical protein
MVSVWNSQFKKAQLLRTPSILGTFHPSGLSKNDSFVIFVTHPKTFTPRAVQSPI